VDPWPSGMEPAYLQVEIDYPLDFEGAAVTLAVNGQEPARTSAGGGSEDGRLRSSYLISPGEPGTKSVTVTLRAGERTLTDSRTVEFRSRGGAAFLNYADGEAVWQQPEVKVFVYFLENLNLTLNGRLAAFQQVSDSEFPGHHVLTVTEGLQPGLNRLKFKGTDKQGQEVVQGFSLYWVKDGVVKQGDAFLVFLGNMGNKSGPFYYLKATGPALARGSAKWGEFFALEDGHWLKKGKKMLQEVRAQAPGEEVMTVLVKKHFLQGLEVDRELKVQVVP